MPTGKVVTTVRQAGVDLTKPGLPTREPEWYIIYADEVMKLKLMKQTP